MGHDFLPQHRLTIVTGHYGTGKTEYSVNLALALAETEKKVVLADLDIVNPYFRSRERRPLLEQAGIQVISSSQACTDADVPALPAQLLTILQDRSITGVLDIGGDPVGARVLARFRPQLMAEDAQLVYVVNANRPEVREVEQAEAYLRDIEAVTGLTCTALVNNTHLCGETTAEDIRKGALLTQALSVRTGIPILCHTVMKHLAQQPGQELPQPLFLMKPYMKKPWEAFPAS